MNISYDEMIEENPEKELMIASIGGSDEDADARDQQ